MLKQKLFWSFIALGISLLIYTDSQREPYLEEEQMELVFHEQLEDGILMLGYDNNYYFVDNATLTSKNINNIENEILSVSLNEFGEIVAINK